MPGPADGLNPEEAREVQISYESTDEMVKIKLVLGDASIKIKSTSEEGGEDAAMLVKILPQALERVYDQIEAEEAE